MNRIDVKTLLADPAHRRRLMVGVRYLYCGHDPWLVRRQSRQKLEDQE